MPLSCPECGDDVEGTVVPDDPLRDGRGRAHPEGFGPGDEYFWDGEKYMCAGCHLLWRVSADGEEDGAWIPDQACPGCGNEGSFEECAPGCVVVTMDRAIDWRMSWDVPALDGWQDTGGEG